MSGKQQNTKTTSPVAIDTTPNAATEVDVENDLDSSTVCSTSHCLNCGSELKGTYCHNCGQHVTDHAMTVKRFILDYLDNAFLWDSRNIETIKRLVTKPGVLTKEYISGKFVSQVQPLKLNMFLLLFFVTLFVFFGSDQKMTNAVQNFTSDERVYPVMQMELICENVDLMERIDASPCDTLTIQAPLCIVDEYPTVVQSLRVMHDTGGEGLDEFVAVLPQLFIDERIVLPHENGVYYFNPDFDIVSENVALFKAIWEQLSKLVIQYFPMLILLTAPFIAFSLSLVQHRKKRPFYDHFIFSMHYIAFLELIIILIYIMHLVLKVPAYLLDTVFMLSSVTYLALSFREVYETVWLRSITKAILSSLIYYAICFVIFLILVFIAIFMVAITYS